MATGRFHLYNKVRQLFVQFEQSTRKLPVSVKRGQVARIEDELVQILVDLCYADEAADDARVKDRLAFIAMVGDTLHDVMIRIRVLHDLKFIKDKSFNALTKIEDNAAGQLAGWKIATENRIEKQ